MFKVHPVSSNQTGLHPRLDETVTRHLASPYLRPPAAPTRLVFDALLPHWRQATQPWLLDAGCGKGESSLHLARTFPRAQVLGIDKSQARLSQGTRSLENLPANLTMVQADLIDFCLLADTVGWRFDCIYLLYPNPWPKSEHLQRRWHGHAIFPSLLKLANHIELRSNWPVYVDEFARALQLAGVEAVETQDWRPDEPITAFERKYLLAGQELYRLTAKLI